ncbi:MAG: hypothetical protein KAT00_09915 [Planctomycetes bacterium]|nr:hypothetical protein [Planctomycetota bacterium]
MKSSEKSAISARQGIICGPNEPWKRHPDHPVWGFNGELPRFLAGPGFSVFAQNGEKKSIKWLSCGKGAMLN